MNQSIVRRTATIGLAVILLMGSTLPVFAQNTNSNMNTGTTGSLTAKAKVQARTAARKTYLAALKADAAQYKTDAKAARTTLAAALKAAGTDKTAKAAARKAYTDAMKAAKTKMQDANKAAKTAYQAALASIK